MTGHEYAIRYGEKLVRDPSWRCVADVIATYHGTDWLTPEGQVTGQLVRRSASSDDWELVSA